MQFTTTGLPFIVQKVLTNAPAIDSGYTGRITANVTDTYTSIKFLAVNISDSKTYTFSVQNSAAKGASATVTIVVQGK